MNPHRRILRLISSFFRIKESKSTACHCSKRNRMTEKQETWSLVHLSCRLINHAQLWVSTSLSPSPMLCRRRNMIHIFPKEFFQSCDSIPNSRTSRELLNKVYFLLLPRLKTELVKQGLSQPPMLYCGSCRSSPLPSTCHVR